MARMIPATGPQDTNSRGEKKIYDLLKQGLSDDFTVIHSLPWLARGVKGIDSKYAPTGEIDFLIIPYKICSCRSYRLASCAPASFPSVRQPSPPTVPTTGDRAKALVKRINRSHDN